MSGILKCFLFHYIAKVHAPGPYPLIASVYGGPHVQRVNRNVGAGMTGGIGWI